MLLRVPQTNRSPSSNPAPPPPPQAQSMAYQVLARKWRPQDFSSLVGQENIVTALRNALKEGRIAQAYLFSGIRGVGKTTAARVLAKALNCENAPAADPCNRCASCLDIGSGQSMDVIEVDAATYSKVEQIRELTDSLRYGPARGRYKVVVLDEVHRLSRQAFDALLKIVEEPPAHLIFIFATTEIDAVPATILSRCQEFQFRRVPSVQMVAHLRTICTAEGITCSDNALRLIARSGEGSVRDSVALLDQLSTFGSGHIDDQDAQRLLGGLDASLFQTLLAAILDGDQISIVREVRKIEESGWDPQHVFGQFLSFCRDGLHLVLGVPLEAVELTHDDAEQLRQKIKPIGYERMLQVLQVMLSSESQVKRSDFGLLALEIVFLRASELPKVVRIEELLGERSQKSPDLELRERPPALELKAPTRSLVEDWAPPTQARPIPTPTLPASTTPAFKELPTALGQAAKTPNRAHLLATIPEDQRTVRAVLSLFGGRIQEIRDESDEEETT